MAPETCLCCCPQHRKDELFACMSALYPHAELVHTESASELRKLALEHGDGRCVAAAGFSERGVSDINLCAAIVRDGCVAETTLVTEAASGSLRSRAASAGISRVIEAGSAPRRPAREPAQRVDQTKAPSPERPLREGAGAGAPLVVFCSGRGGVGKTAIVSVAAHIAASWGMRVALLDLDLANGDLFARLGCAQGCDLAQFGTCGDSSVMAKPVHVAENIHLWGPCSLPEMAEVASPHIGELIAHARTHADLVLADTSSTTTDAVAEALQHADRAVLVYDGRRSSLAFLARMGGLAVRPGVARARIMRLENHADPYTRPDFSLGRTEVGLEVARPLRVFEGGREVSQLLDEGRAHELSRYASDFTTSIASCLAQILSELGCLPACDEALRASKEPTVKRRFWKFSRAREAS